MKNKELEFCELITFGLVSGPRVSRSWCSDHERAAAGRGYLTSKQAVISLEEAHGLLVDFPRETAGHFFSPPLDTVGKTSSRVPLATGRVKEKRKVWTSRAEESSLVPGIGRLLAPPQVLLCCPQDTPSLDRLLKCDFLATLPNCVLPMSTLHTWTQQDPDRDPDGFYRTRRTASTLSRKS